TSLGLAALALLRPPRHLRQIMFAAGIVALAVETALIDWLLSPSAAPAHPRFLVLPFRPLSLPPPNPPCHFSVSPPRVRGGHLAFLAGRGADATVPHNWRISFALGGSGLVVAALANLAWPFFSVTIGVPRFRYAETTQVGQIGVAVELLATIAVLYGLEPSL